MEDQTRTIGRRRGPSNRLPISLDLGGFPYVDVPMALALTGVRQRVNATTERPRRLLGTETSLDRFCACIFAEQAVATLREIALDCVSRTLQSVSCGARAVLFESHPTMLNWLRRRPRTEQRR